MSNAAAARPAGHSFDGAIGEVAAADTADRYGSSADPSSDGLPAAEHRGRTVMSEHAAERIAGIAAAEVDGVVGTSGGGIGRALRKGYPRATVQVAGDRALVDADIAVVWGSDVAATAAGVRAHVRDRLKEYGGLAADRVNVTVAVITAPAASPAEAPRRVR